MVSAFRGMLERDRVRRGSTVGQVAWRLRISPREYRELEAGEDWPTWKTWDRMVKLFGWPHEDLRIAACNDTRLDERIQVEGLMPPAWPGVQNPPSDTESKQRRDARDRPLPDQDPPLEDHTGSPSSAGSSVNRATPVPSAAVM
jgi:hypothetical protein